MSVIPKARPHLTPYQVFVEEINPQLAAAFPALSQGERTSKAGDLWKELSAEALATYKLKSEALKMEAHTEFVLDEDNREEQRREYCIRLGLPTTASWTEVDQQHHAVWTQQLQGHDHDDAPQEENTQNDDINSPQKERSVEMEVEHVEQHDQRDVGTEDEEVRHGTIAQVNKGRRAASAAATQKMSEQRGLSFGLRDPEAKLKRRGEVGSRKRMRRAPKVRTTASASSSATTSGGGTSGGGGGGSMMASADMWKPGARGEGGATSFDEGSGAGLKVSKSRLGDREWQEALWGEERVLAVTKAIDRVYDMSLSDNNFNLFGNDMIQCFYDVASVTGEPIRSKTLKYVEHLANRWKYTVMQEGWKLEARPAPCEVIEVVTGMYCMERVGIRHDLKEEVLAFLAGEQAYSAREYFGWDPLGREGPPRQGGWEVISDTTVSRFRLFSSSLIHSFYADRVGLALGCPFESIFQWLPMLRPYKGPADLSWQHYIDQCYLVTHVVFTANNWGELRLMPALFPHEYFFLRAHLPVHIFVRDVHLIAEFVESLRCFGCTDDDPLIRQGMRALLDSQAAQGIWDDTDNADNYRTYHATMCGAQALLAHKFRGFGPGIPAILPLLTRWAEEDRDGGKNAEVVLTLTQQCEEAMKQRHMQVKDSREQEYLDLHLCLSPLDHAGAAGGEAVWNTWGGSIHQPVDMPAHSEERLATLKGAIRGFAKRHQDTPSETTDASTGPQAPAASSSISETAPPSEEMSEADTNTLSHLSGLITAYLSKSRETPPGPEESGSLLEALGQAEHVPVSASVLQSSQFGTLAKQIRQVAKVAKGGSVAGLSEKAAAVVSQWKQSILSRP